ncbi:hypothetical protein BDFB_008395, partial [Asbolus verrucosus]
ILQILRSILWIWPIVIIAIILVAAPSLRITLTQEIIPKKVDEIMQILENKHSNSLNNETANWFN